MSAVYMTKDRLLKLEEELQDLKGRGRKEIAQKIADARSHGDLSENADYDAAKHEQELMEMKLANMQRILSQVQVIDPNDFPNDKVYILSTAKLKNRKNNAIITYTLVSAEEADFEQNKIAVSSPLGKAMMGKTVGEIVTLKVPAGTTEYEILEIGKYESLSNE